ncbi:MAG: iron hydrogenase [Patescibacteria group bacterium]
MTKTAILIKPNVVYLTKFTLLLAIATFAPFIGFHSQWITGPLVNAALILSVYMVGARGALLIGMLPSTIALSTGLLPAMLAPMIPFIIISNSLLILVVDFIYKKSLIKNFNVNYATGLVVASGVKSLFLFLTSSVVVGLLIKQELAVKVATMMSYPQFITAIIGGIIVFGFLKILKK